MMWGFFKHEWREFFTNRKNMAVYLLLIFLSLFYWIQIENSFEIIERVSRQELQASVDTKTEFLDTVNQEGEVHPDTQAAIDSFPAIVENEEQQLQLLDKKEYKKFSEVRSQWYQGLKYKPSPLYYKDGSSFADLEYFYQSASMIVKLTEYSQLKEPINLKTINEKTATHSLIRAMDYLIPVILLVCGLIFSMDLLARDRKHPSMIKGMPITDGKKLIVKGSVAFLGTVATCLPLSVGFIGMGLKNGFGSLNLPVATSKFPGKIPLLGDIIFDNMSVGQFFLRFFILVTLLVLIVIAINLCLGIWIKNAYFLLIITLGLPFIELFYNRPGYGDIHAINYLPTSYVHVGEIISGHRSFFWSGTQITFEFSLIILGITLFVLVMLLFITSRFKRIV
ncbi:MAG: hypothetical protein RR554_11015 [Vagococcus sp.]|uniref:hypothetical protein n=1 Tax=Vagococcus sp. TaxID=1933889 RepID=UPI002FC71A62